MTDREYQRAQEVILQISQSSGCSPARVRQEMQLAIDQAWASLDPAAQQLQQELFPGGKPSLEQFLVRIAGELQGDAQIILW